MISLIDMVYKDTLVTTTEEWFGIESRAIVIMNSEGDDIN